MQLIDTFNSYPTLPPLLALLFGLLVGSFLNVVVYRLPIMLERQWKRECALLLDAEQQAEEEPFNLAVPRSRCPHCGHAISAAENVPVISYLLLRGRCKGCGSAISVRYPLVELATGLLSALVIWQFGLNLVGAGLLLLVWSLICLTLIDYDTQLLPDDITLPLLWAGLIFNAVGGLASLEDAFWGAVAGYLSLWSVYQVFKLATGKEGMGYGDFKLLAALGAWLGWQTLPLIVILSSAVGALWGIGLHLLTRRDAARPMPFGPFLAIAGAVTLFAGDEITARYFNLLGF